MTSLTKWLLFLPFTVTNAKNIASFFCHFHSNLNSVCGKLWETMLHRMTKKTNMILCGTVFINEKDWGGRREKNKDYKYELQHLLIVILLFYEDGVIKSTSQDAVLEIGNCNILFFVLTSQVYSISLLTTLNVLSILHSSFPSFFSLICLLSLTLQTSFPTYPSSPSPA